jgi:dolichol-phosphate mannosyltransferase
MGEGDAAASRVLIVMPTYNERQNLEIMAGRVREAVPDTDLLVVDDNSPDGTGDLADKLTEADPHVQVMHRTEKAGLGRAYVAGFTWALERGYDLIVEMDADGSHRPEDLPKLLAAAARSDAVIGSRYVPGGTVVNWPKSREFLSKGANLYNRIMLGVKVKDATGGFRVYHAATLRGIDLNGIESAGYCFQIDMTLRVLQAGMTITEVPITFVERERGASKMSRTVIIEAFTCAAVRPPASGASHQALAKAKPRGGKPPGPMFSGAAAVGDVGDGASLHGPPLLHDLKPLREHRLKVFNRPPLHEHVPVAARRLDLLGGRRLASARRGHGTADTTLPHRG